MGFFYDGGGSFILPKLEEIELEKLFAAAKDFYANSGYPGKEMEDVMAFLRKH